MTPLLLSNKKGANSPIMFASLKQQSTIKNSNFILKSFITPISCRWEIQLLFVIANQFCVDDHANKLPAKALQMICRIDL